jgi:hypothetical protein
MEDGVKMNHISLYCNNLLLVLNISILSRIYIYSNKQVPSLQLDCNE